VWRVSWSDAAWAERALAVLELSSTTTISHAKKRKTARAAALAQKKKSGTSPYAHCLVADGRQSIIMLCYIFRINNTFHRASYRDASWANGTDDWWRCAPSAFCDSFSPVTAFRAPPLRRFAAARLPRRTRPSLVRAGDIRVPAIPPYLPSSVARRWKRRILRRTRCTRSPRWRGRAGRKTGTLTCLRLPGFCVARGEPTLRFVLAYGSGGIGVSALKTGRGRGGAVAIPMLRWRL